MQGWSELNQGQGFSCYPLYRTSCPLPSLSWPTEIQGWCTTPSSTTRHISTWRLRRAQCRQTGWAHFPWVTLYWDQSLLWWLGCPRSWRRGAVRTTAMCTLPLNSATKLRLLQFILLGKPLPEGSREFMTELCQSMNWPVRSEETEGSWPVHLLHLLPHQQGAQWQIIGTANKCIMKNIHTSSVLSSCFNWTFLLCWWRQRPIILSSSFSC